MNIKVNGEQKSVTLKGGAIDELLRELAVENPEMVSVELNGEIVSRDRFEEALIADGAEVEFIYFMGGGAVDFTETQIERYSRHFILEEIGGEGQAKLLESSVLVIGTGGLGSPAAYYLAASGVGRIGLVDFDKVELSNLQRQILHSTERVGEPKVTSAATALRALNPDVQVETHNVFADHTNILQLIEGYDFVVDAVDSFGAKFLINDACVLAGKPFVHAGALQFQGQLFVHTDDTACLRCIFPKPPADDAVPTCASAGILSAQVGLMGVLQAIETLKFLLGVGDLLVNRGLSFDAKRAGFKEFKFKKNSHCPICGDAPSITELTPVAAAQCEVPLAI